MNPTDSQFCAIIVGAGPAGLATALCLSAAGINFIVLERRSSVVQETGASLGLWPQGVRLLHQLNILEAAEQISEPLKFSYHYDQDGTEISKAPIFDMIEERHGYPFMLFERMRFIEMLHDQLPDKSRVETSRNVVEIEQDDARITVTLDDGTHRTGDIVIAADGVNSSVRDQIWDDLSGTSALTSKYKCLFGCSARPAGDKSNGMIETHNSGFSFQLLCQSQRIFWFLYVKLDDPTTNPTKYTAADAEALAKQYLDKPITPDLTFQSLWESRIRVTLANMEQGMQSNWHSGRAVLVGDAAHKMTPNLAYGFNTAFESAASLTNHLATALVATSGDAPLRPDLSTVTEVFGDYQKQRFARAKLCHDFANFYTRFAAWEYSLFKWASKIAPKVMADSVMVDQFAKLVKGGEKLDFLDIPDKRHGTIKFDDER